MCEETGRMQGATGQHECEVFPGKEKEAAESEYLWNSCRKNPGHSQFFSVQNFVDNYVPKIANGDERVVKKLKGMIDLTVRIRLQWTSRKRPDDDDFATDRGTGKLRMGTGFIQHGICISPDEMFTLMESKGTCPKVQREGKVSGKHYVFNVQTARHVVFNAEEAKWTKVDLFYGDDSSLEDGRMKTLKGLDVIECDYFRDQCLILCATQDEEIGERILTALGDQDHHFRIPDLSRSSESRGTGNASDVLIISHPHGQPKKITAGGLASLWVSWTSQMLFAKDTVPLSSEAEMARDPQHGSFVKSAPDYLKRLGKRAKMCYTAHTCPGSSGAPVFQLSLQNKARFSTIAAFPHSGSFSTTIPTDGSINSFPSNLFRRFYTRQVNYCCNVKFNPGIAFANIIHDFWESHTT